MKIIPLTNGGCMEVSDVDFDDLNQLKWYKMKLGYVAHREPRRNGKQGQTVMVHRRIMNAPDGLIVDHINGNKLDNRRENLRLCNKSQNGRNRDKQSNNTSGYKGVTWHKQRKKWAAQISVDGKHISLGNYENIIDAAEAHEKASRLYFGDFHYKAKGETNESVAFTE